jgi:hypothetical protein
LGRDAAMKDCPWCEYNPKCDRDKTCDFRSLKMQKKDILERIKFEKTFVDKAKETLLKDRQHMKIAQKDIAELMDKLAGISIMTKVLQEKFKMTEEQVREECGFKALSLLQKARLAMIMQSMRRD